MKPRTWFVLSAAMPLAAFVACGETPRPAQPAMPTSIASAPPAATASASSAAPAAPPESARFAAIRDRFFDTWLARDPEWARACGLHDAYDGKSADLSKEGLAQSAKLAREGLAELDGVDAAKLAPDDALDLAEMKTELRMRLFRHDDVHEWQKRPARYAELFGVDDYLDTEYAPLEERARRLVAHEEAALGQVAHFHENVALPLSRPITEVAIRQYRGFASYLRGEVTERLAKIGDDAFKARFKSANDKLASEADKIAEWLEKKALPTANDEHVLGRERYGKLLFAQEGLAMTLEDFKRINEDDLAANKQAYEALVAKKVVPTRPKVGDYLDVAKKITEEARLFVIDHHVVTLPSEERATVRETPPFDRYNPASLTMTGPFDDKQVAFFNVTLPDPSLSKKEQAEYVQTYGALRATTVHEVYPGHFVHGLWMRRAPSRMQKSTGSYTFTEGWAHYAEQMMLDEGFGASEPQNRMGQLQQALVRNCRYAASIAIHVENKSLDDVAKRFVRDCHVDVANAREQTRRGTFDPGYFAYTLGKLQIMALRAEAKKRLGDKFSLQRFHDALLAHGAPPVALVRERVLADLGASQ